MQKCISEEHRPIPRVRFTLDWWIKWHERLFSTQWRRGIRSSAIRRGVTSWMMPDVSRQRSSLETSGIKQVTLCHIPGERIPQLYRYASLRIRITTTTVFNSEVETNFGGILLYGDPQNIPFLVIHNDLNHRTVLKHTSSTQYKYLFKPELPEVGT